MLYPEVIIHLQQDHSSIHDSSSSLWNTHHSQRTDIHATGGFEPTISRRGAVDRLATGTGEVSQLLDYTFGIKHPYRRHRYILQNVLIMQAVQLTLYTMENSSPLVGDQAPRVDRHTTTAFAGRHIPRVVMLSLRSVN